MFSLTIANAGVPMLLVYGPVLLITLIPIILIETSIIDRRMRFGFGPMFKRVAAANAVSTLVGVPLTWIGLVLVEFVLHETPLGGDASLSFVVQAPWLFPHETDLAWLIPSAGVVLTVPFWVVSVFVESAVLNRMLPKGAEGVPIRRVCAFANAVTYALLVAFWGVMLALGISGP